MSHDYTAIGNRWISVWNDKDLKAHQALTQSIWTSTANHYAPGFEGHGLAQIADRVEAVHQRFVVKGGCEIRGVNFSGYGNVLRILWEIAPASGGAPLATGCEVLLLDDEGKVASDYQFNDPSAIPK